MSAFRLGDFSQLSPHFTLEEATHSQTATRLGIDNAPVDIETLERIRQAAEQMELVRSLLRDEPITVSSWYRSPALNTAVGSGPTSAHLLGLAVDLICPGFGSPLDIARHLASHSRGTPLRYDQIIHEGSWVHVGFLGRERRELLTAVFVPGHATQYMAGLRPA